ncbi:hypothetical protein ACNTMW_09950 [Planosporangium sp. 12N6]|uniref:hypothetical protein n=1 Tax=Planosporangium spinosum TaxID=3402278 RepID=UPI003CF65D33
MVREHPRGFTLRADAPAEGQMEHMGPPATATARANVRPGDPQTRTHLLIGALCEGGILLARAAKPETTLALVTHEIDTLLAARARPEAPGTPDDPAIASSRRQLTPLVDDVRTHVGPGLTTGPYVIKL